MTFKLNQNLNEFKVSNESIYTLRKHLLHKTLNQKLNLIINTVQQYNKHLLNGQIFKYISWIIHHPLLLIHADNRILIHNEIMMYLMNTSLLLFLKIYIKCICIFSKVYGVNKNCIMHDTCIIAFDYSSISITLNPSTQLTVLTLLHRQSRFGRVHHFTHLTWIKSFIFSDISK